LATLEHARFRTGITNKIELPARSNYRPTYVIFETSLETQFLVPKQKGTIWLHRQFVFYIALFSSPPFNTKPDTQSTAFVHALIVKVFCTRVVLTVPCIELRKSTTFHITFSV
jgi:hypothetical protein